MKLLVAIAGIAAIGAGITAAEQNERASRVKATQWIPSNHSD
jgi:hypothetical protein